MKRKIMLGLALAGAVAIALYVKRRLGGTTAANPDPTKNPPYSIAPKLNPFADINVN